MGSCGKCRSKKDTGFSTFLNQVTRVVKYEGDSERFFSVNGRQYIAKPKEPFLSVNPNDVESLLSRQINSKRLFSLVEIE